MVSDGGDTVGVRLGEVLVMARSRTSSSELGAFRRSSTMLTVGYSRPMIGVVSSNANSSKAPLGFSGAGYRGWSVGPSPLDAGCEWMGRSADSPGAMICTV